MSSFEAVAHRGGVSPMWASQSDRHTSAQAQEALLAFAMTLLGMSLALDRFLPVTLGPVTLTFVIMLGLSTLGFWLGITDVVVRRFTLWSLGFSAFAVISLAANAPLASLKDSAGILLWLLGVPGIATLCVDRRRFRALLLGLVIGASALLVVVVWRYVTGATVLDAAHPQLLGLNRNAIDMSIVWLIPPVMWGRTLTIPRLGRWAFLAASILWLVSSKGRTGLLALLLVPLVFTLLKPASPMSRGARIAAVVAVGFLLYTALTTLSLPGLPAVERITQYNSAKRTSADEIRLLLNEKSLALAAKHPVTGVGFGLYEGQYDPIIEKAGTAHIREQSLRLQAHNTYYELLATTGIPGFFLYVGALLVPLAAGVRHARDRDVQALAAGFVIVLFAITFHTSYGSIVALPLALTLAAIARARQSDNVADSVQSTLS